jgi:hypothetical protein
MADLFQGSALPSTTTTTSTQQTSPEFYTDYLQNIANLGQNAVQQGGVAGFSPLQQQAFNMAPSTAFSGQGAATQAQALTNASGTTSAPSIINDYMNPYTGKVVDEMARLQQQNLQRNVLPTIAGGGVGTGSFGSKRQSQALGQSLADMQANLTGQQYGALNTGYQNAMQSAQADLNRQLQAGQGMGNIATQQYQIGSGGLNTLSSLGALQQAQGQRQLDYPMTQAQNYANLLHGLNIPTGQVQQTVAPGQQGQFTNSPLSQIAGLGTLLAAISGAGTSNTSLIDQLTKLFNSDSTTTPTTTPPPKKDGGSIHSYADGGTVDLDAQSSEPAFDNSFYTQYGGIGDPNSYNANEKPIFTQNQFQVAYPNSQPGDYQSYLNANPQAQEFFDANTNNAGYASGKLPDGFYQYGKPEVTTPTIDPIAYASGLPSTDGMSNQQTVSPGFINAGPVGQTATIDNPNQGGYNPRPLPYERTNVALPTTPAPIRKKPDFTNMIPAPHRLIRHLQNVQSTQIPVDQPVKRVPVVQPSPFPRVNRGTPQQDTASFHHINLGKV